MRLQLSTWPEVADYLSTRRGVIIPIGSTEQHGPSGLIGTDAITAEVVSWRAGEVLDTLVAPTIAVGMAHHHMAFPGSMTLRPSTLIAVIRDTILALSSHGFTRFLFVNGHGGNIPSIQSAFYEAYEEMRVHHGDGAPDIACQLCSWFSSPAVEALAAEAFGDAEGSHATPSEVSVTWHAYPDQQRTPVLDPPVAPQGRFTDSRDFRRAFPDGRIGSNPALATPELGGRFVEVAVDYIATTYGDFLKG
ncbi:creatininase family protein [Rhodospirillum rubrum]|uniref:Creatininase n=1 Tax=Rhodospirillum rubrum (strain ATCC 11170 / ATH 1.1.1 / DSM 467 / LMG 4362 / NCIMB 8255 / S1) TaxID=269796 RepID=Q2RSD6_RHORT|nr:creatininase family protein [Rhodospirillum rubrum]ABC22959.1 Creatininase [Rhodospirillum rubrum ATCC 11170]AEO48689.1 creatininase [Rhodospirillum rubrum F11]MBK5954584.1 creatininase [Rhodospirillum rubrum]QXG78945.1 creatininase family protein [Rhodospirillum rubrum]HAQ01406.1 creatininase family protein [Rhodospirillum rubrum]